MKRANTVMEAAGPQQRISVFRNVNRAAAAACSEDTALTERYLHVPPYYYFDGHAVFTLNFFDDVLLLLFSFTVVYLLKVLTVKLARRSYRV